VPAASERGYEAETIPGVTSFCACAALLNRSLTDMHAPLHILPASFLNLQEALALPGGKVLMKSSSALPEVLRRIRELGLSGRASVVSDCGLPTQRIYRNIDEAAAYESYFTTI
jgi:precorrin-2/cobalt-factor-2 C20-methyltransferase